MKGRLRRLGVGCLHSNASQRQMSESIIKDNISEVTIFTRNYFFYKNGTQVYTYDPENNFIVIATDVMQICMYVIPITV